MPTNSLFHFINLLVQHIKYTKLQKKINMMQLFIIIETSICSRIATFFLNKKIKSIYFSRGMYFHDDQNFLQNF